MIKSQEYKLSQPIYYLDMFGNNKEEYLTDMKLNEMVSVPVKL